ncbi:MAG: hypothetical protein KUG61_00805 [Parvibaculaceae bacterium]|nr:hypothetical protein [Parvibaculaceae bacterium]
MKIAQGELHREAKRIFRRLVEPETYLSAVDADKYGLFVPRNRGAKPVMKVEKKLVHAFCREDWLEKNQVTDEVAHPESVRYKLSKVGLAWWGRRSTEVGAEPFQRQHQELGVATTGTGKVNFAESPLAWLHRRKGRDGKTFLSNAEFDAGERFRIDFTKAQLTPSLTANWERQAIGRNKRSHNGGLILDANHRALMARKRYDRALDAVGPGLKDVLIDVCCHLQGLDGVEKAMCWPQRSGKVVLKIALDRLVQHYEMRGRDN